MDAYPASKNSALPHRFEHRELRVEATGRIMEFSSAENVEALGHHMHHTGMARHFITTSGDASTYQMAFRQGAEGADTLLLGGFYLPEAWGAWSRITDPWIVLSFMVSGEVELSILCMGAGLNIGKRIAVELGGDSKTITLTPEPQWHTLTLNVGSPTNILCFSNLIAQRLEGIVDVRTMGIGLIEVVARPISRWWQRLLARPKVGAVPAPKSLAHRGIVYLCPLNDDDNWSDVLSAFCLTMRHEPDALLLFASVQPVGRVLLAEFIRAHHSLGACSCKIAIIESLEDTTWSAVLAQAHYMVSASPDTSHATQIQQAAKAGLPVIAPTHALSALPSQSPSMIPVKAGREPAPDGDGFWRLYRYRIDWSALYHALRESLHIFRHEKDRYIRMTTINASQAGTLTESLHPNSSPQG